MEVIIVLMLIIFSVYITYKIQKPGVKSLKNTFLFIKDQFEKKED